MSAGEIQPTTKMDWRGNRWWVTLSGLSPTGAHTSIEVTLEDWMKLSAVDYVVQEELMKQRNEIDHLREGLRLIQHFGDLRGAAWCVATVRDFLVDNDECSDG